VERIGLGYILWLDTTTMKTAGTWWKAAEAGGGDGDDEEGFHC
jgi:hypothetical protein